jgi:hypothetical protein
MAARVRDLEREVTEAEESLASLQQELEDAAARQDVEHIRTLGQAVVDAEGRLEHLLSAWESAASAAGA